MSDGSELHRSDAATGKERRPTVVSLFVDCCFNVFIQDRFYRATLC